MSACAAGCGLAAEPGDIYCSGDREAVERDRDMDVFESSHDDGLT